MGSRKNKMAVNLKNKNKGLVTAKLNKCPTSPSKMRVVADLVRGKDVDKALDIVKFSSKFENFFSSISFGKNSNEEFVK